jgi:hypothetical protein
MFPKGVYKVSKVPGTFVLSPFTNYAINGLITGASYNKVKKEIVLIGYQNNHAASFLWYLNDFTNDQFFNGNKRRIEIGNASDWQTEGICYKGDSMIYISCETTNISNSLYKSNRYNLLTTTTRSISNNDILFYPNPASSFLRISSQKV